MKEWIVQIDDITPFCREIHALIAGGRVEEAKAMLPAERLYVLQSDLAQTINANL